MYLSYLLIDVGMNPDRPRPGRLWLRNRYRVHQRLCMAFPSDPRRRDDPNFLKPYVPAEFAQTQVHVARRTQTGFLFRIDPQLGGRVMILVQSAMKPDWDYAFGLKNDGHDPLTGRPMGNAGHLLAAPPETIIIDPRFETRQQLRFRLLANPTVKTGTLSKGERLAKAPKRHGRRLPVAVAELSSWLSDKGRKAGFRIIEDTNIIPGYVYVNKSHEAGEGQRLWSVRFEGVLEVTDPSSFSEAIIRGIGPAKAFGFGLLSVAPVR